MLKLWQKENVVVRRSQNFYIFFFLVLVIFTGALFFAGSDLLLVIFALTLAAIFFVLGAYKASSPYSFVGAQRELIQMMAYEPMVLLTAIGMYMVTKSFYVHEIASHPTLLVLALPGIFLGFLYTLEIKFRKSPFDLSCSHHAHQELVRGITTEFSGRALALIEIAHWYENVFLLGWVYLFFAASPPLGVAVSLLVFGFVILVDNVFARLKWQTALAERLAGGGGAGLWEHPGAVLAAAPVEETRSTMRGIKESPWIIHYDASSCNGCDIETLACLTPLYDVERLGVVNTGNPKHADIFLVTGAVNEQSQAVIRNIYHQLPEPKVVVAVGICACSGGIFRECYNISRRRGQRHPGGCVCARLRRAARRPSSTAWSKPWRCWMKSTGR